MNRENKKSQQHVPTQMVVQGARDPDGSRWIKVSFRDLSSRWLPFASFRKSGLAAESTLADQGLIFLKPEFALLMSLVSELSKFPPRNVAAQAGWSGSNYALPSGYLCVPASEEIDPAIAFSPAANRDAKRGTAKGWRKNVAAPLSGQALASFVMMIPFAAPLLRLSNHPTNFGFEIAGGGGIGKSTICKLAMSAIGPLDNMTISMNATINAIDQLMLEYNDQVLMLEEWNIMALQGGNNAGREAAKLAFTMADGTSKRRYDAQASQRVRLLWLTSTNRPLPHMLEGIDPDTAKAAADRMLTIEIPLTREHGIFDGPGGKYATVSQMANGLVQAATEQHGAAFRKYLRKLVNAYAEDPASFRSRLESAQKRFLDQVATAGTLPTHRRVAEAFGLVYTAGSLAKHFKVLPSAYECMTATKVAYGLHVDSRTALATPVDRLKVLLTSPDLLDIRETWHAKKKQLESASGVLHRNASRGDELLLTRDQLNALTPNPSAFLKNPAIRACLDVEDKRLKVYRYVVSKRERMRFYCFSLALLDDQGH